MAYSTMTATQLRETVRAIVDLDSGDLSDSLLNMYLRDGYYRILDMEKRWPFLETSFTFNTVASQRSYTISTFTADPISQIVSVLDPTDVGFRLNMVGYDEAEEVHIGSMDSPGTPLVYAFWANQIHLFPKPDNVRTLTVRAYREPIDWVTSGGAVDASANLHFALVYYACSRIYQRLEDTEMSAEYKSSFNEAVVLAAKNIKIPQSHANLRLNSANAGSRTLDGWLKSLSRNGTLHN